MSVDRTDYIVYGWRLSYGLKNSKDEEINFWDDKYLPMIEGHPDEKYSIIRDGMWSDYTVFGKVIADADEDAGWEFTHLNNLKVDPNELKDKYREVFEIEGEVADPYLFIFSHFS